MNGNGVQDTNEAGLADNTVYLDANNNGQLDTGETFTTTNSDGNYSFTNLLKPYLNQVFPECYEDAIKLAADETGFPLNIVDDKAMFTPEETLDTEYLP